VVLALLLGGALVLVVLIGSVATDLLAARQRAAAAADLGALAGAPAAVRSAEDACRSAAWVVRSNGATLRGCDVVDGDVRITVSVAPRGSFARWWGSVLGGIPEPTVSAHAGMRADP
jgi:secretion/DNA translocation related TadE-like protein